MDQACLFPPYWAFYWLDNLFLPYFFAFPPFYCGYTTISWVRYGDSKMGRHVLIPSHVIAMQIVMENVNPLFFDQVVIL
jgi:hypothetical protein